MVVGCLQTMQNVMENLKFKRQQKLKVILEFRSLILVCSPPHCCLQNCFHQRQKCIKVFKCKSYQCITLNTGNVQFNLIFFFTSETYTILRDKRKRFQIYTYSQYQKFDSEFKSLLEFLNVFCVTSCNKTAKTFLTKQLWILKAVCNYSL